MSFELGMKTDFPQPIFQFLPLEISEEDFADLPLLGGILSNIKHTWHAKGPCIEVRDISTGKKVGSWVFGGSIKDLHTRIICVDEIKADNGRLPLLMVALETVGGGQICVLDVFNSRVLRAINIEDQILETLEELNLEQKASRCRSCLRNRRNDYASEQFQRDEACDQLKISSIHIVDSGNELSIIPEPSPFRYFDGIVAVGARGGNVYLVDICRQICEDALENPEVSIYRDELYPCDMVVLPYEKFKNIKKYIERCMEKGEHIGVHINVVPKPKTDHFTLQGEKGEDRVYVNKTEVEVSSLHYATQIASLLVGYNFGAFQIWDLRHLLLAYTSPISDDHIPITHFAVQEPADDPKAYCYIWVSYSQNLLFSSGVPYAVMYSFYYDVKKFLGSYGNLYENFQHCSVRFQIELGTANLSGFSSRVRGGSCIGFQSISKNLSSSSLALCLVSWLIWDSSRNLQTCVLLFDLNQWYKEQMPSVPDWSNYSNYSNYIIKNGMNTHLLDVKLDKKLITQFVGVQKLEEHFCPTSLDFDVICMSDSNVLKIHNRSFQKALIDKLEVDGHLALCRPSDYYEQIISLGLTPIFCDMPVNLSNDTGFHRELLLNMILEQKLVHWLCKCASKLSNDAFNSQGLPLSSLLGWAFQRAIHLKTSCDHFCTCLFDYSGVRLDTNTIALVSNSTSQIKNICSFYNYVSTKLLSCICDKETLLDEQRCLENVTLYYEVLLWMVNIGLLPEGPNVQEIGDLLVAPYEVEELAKYYIGKRGRLQEVSHQTFVEKDCLLFIDNLINNQRVSTIIRQHWQEDGGSGLYPPPSLQSALRVYLLDGTDLIFKHSLMTYTLLDIAVTLNENEKVNVIKMLLKFPQIFDLSQSRIKIVQAFWHLDHDDYQTALDYILDPSVLSEDLQQWHHSVMMKSLLLQDQFTLALLYLQIRKPSLSDEKDLLTVLSLLISKNMLDEAFLFQHKHQSNKGELLLMHIFNECNRNEQLYSLLFRCLDTDEEKTFFKYLQTTKSPRSEDLKIFYYLLRSRFLEAFDTYSNCKIRNPETQGLIGQGSATTADNVVKLFKKLMPDVNRNLLEIVRKEKSNLWKEVNRPTPLSVFALNVKEKVFYKSDVIFATLSKAKRTFNDSFYDNFVNTESMPFLRTPAGPRNGIKLATPVLNCTIVEQHENEEYGPSPRKKLKLSPRISTTSPTKAVSNLSVNKTLSMLTTPIVKRKLSMDKSILSSSTRLPHSILKASRTLSESLINERSAHNLSLEGNRLTLRSRKSMTPSKVKFDDLRYSSSSNEQSSPKISDRSTRESENISNEETFYSPSAFPVTESRSSEVSDKERCKTPEHLDDIEDREQTQNSAIEKIVTDYSKHRMVYQSPKSRRTYQRSLGDSPIPVRSSPRLSEKFTKEASPDVTKVSEPSLSESHPPKPSPSVAVHKLRGRRSLTRAVLEHNTFSKTHSSTYIEKSVLSVSANSSCLTNYSLNNSTVDTDDDFSIKSSTPDASLIELIKEYKYVDSKNTTVHDSLDEDKMVQDLKIDSDKEIVTSNVVTTVKESTFTKRIDIGTETDSNEEMMDYEESVYHPGIDLKDFSKVEERKFIATEEASKQNEAPKNYENNVEIEATMDGNKINDELSPKIDSPTDINKINNEPSSKMNDNDDFNIQDDKQADVDNDALISALYDDLSSGSEDLKDVLQKNNVESVISKSTSQSACFSELLEKDESSQESHQEPGLLDQGFTAEVIEIGSSDDDTPPNIQHDENETSNSSTDSSSEVHTEDSSLSKSPERSNREPSDDSRSTEGVITPIYDQSSGSDKSSSSKGFTEHFERNLGHEESSVDSQKTLEAIDSKRETSEEIDKDDSRESQLTEKMTNYDAKDIAKDSDSDCSKHRKHDEDETSNRCTDHSFEEHSGDSSLSKSPERCLESNRESSDDSRSTGVGVVMPIYDSERSSRSDKSSSNEDSRESFERNIDHGENSVDSQKTLEAAGSERESPEDIDKDSSRESQLTENYHANDIARDSNSDCSEHQKVLFKSHGDNNCDSRNPKKTFVIPTILSEDVEEDNLAHENVSKETDFKEIENIEKVADPENDNGVNINMSETNKIEKAIIKVQDNVIEQKSEHSVKRPNAVSETKKIDEPMEVQDNQIESKMDLVVESQDIKKIQESMEVQDDKIEKSEQPSKHNVKSQEVDGENKTIASEKEKVKGNSLIPIDFEEMDTLQLDYSNPSSPAKEINKTSKALQCTLKFPENSTSKESEKNQETELETNSSVSDDVLEVNDSVISTPAWLKTTIKKTYSKVEKEERELNKTPVLRPVEKTYFRRGRITSQSLTFSGNETEVSEITSKQSQTTLDEITDTTPANVSNDSAEKSDLKVTSKQPQFCSIATVPKPTEDITNTTPGTSANVSKDSAEKYDQINKRATSSAEQSTLSNVDETEKPRRITRRMSANFESSEVSDSPTPTKFSQKILKTDVGIEQTSTPGTPRSRGRPPKLKSINSSQVSSAEETVTEKSKIIEAISGQSSEASKNEDESLETKPKKRSRSTSVDQPQVIRTYSRKLRSKSIDEPIQEASSETDKIKEKSIKIILEPILEIPVARNVKGKANSDLGIYTTSRRLTRTQASILKAVSEVKQVSKLPSVEEMDPINLLDKHPFQGDPDPEESKVYAPSSPSSSSPSISASQRSRRRSTSVVSDAPSLKPPSVTSRASKGTGIKSRLRTASAERSSDMSDSPSPSKATKKALSSAGLKSRLRTASVEGSSDISDSPSPSKKTKKASSSAEAEEVPQTVQKMRTRARTTSGSSNRSIVSNVSNRTNTSTRSTRSKKNIPKKELPKIHEEKNSEVALETPVTSKRGRPKKKKNQ